MLDVLHVQQNLLARQQVVAAGHLRQAGEAGAHLRAVAPSVDALLELLAERGALGPGPDEGHIPLDDVPELRDLVQARLAHELAERRDAGVVALRPLRAAALRVDVHGAELVDPEGLPALADALLRVDGGPRALALDLRRDGRHGDRQDDERAPACHDVERALYEAIPQAAANHRLLQLDDIIARQQLLQHIFGDAVLP